MGCLALAFSAIATAIAIGPWTAPYQIRSVKFVRERFGSLAARSLWLAVAIITGGSGVAILNGVRPNYAAPTIQQEMLR